MGVRQTSRHRPQLRFQHLVLDLASVSHALHMLKNVNTYVEEMGVQHLPAQ
jgi:hypothetical protein